MSEDDPPIVCTLDRGSDTAEEREEQFETELVPKYDGAEETDDGYTVRFDGADEALRGVARFVAEEHKCCSFADYTIEVAPPYDETRLTVEGPEDTKEMFEEFVEMLESTG